jgi:hypothetical protein
MRRIEPDSLEEQLAGLAVASARLALLSVTPMRETSFVTEDVYGLEQILDLLQHLHRPLVQLGEPQDLIQELGGMIESTRESIQAIHENRTS